ncbi:hypothetical protein [Deinococcus hopiensis]|uniref:Lipoprotein n=1 Tax=Deinococcus hopiensis KR-140 TaxID=695939 RepID=A0A1W1UAZ6_9DEIO|nr:hypothetical protein [Deinococcus hopiensis]SMB78265.1 hypothetical protein SAMN00790413_06579 [Deinococcus hopiensis KR-140]
MNRLALALLLLGTAGSLASCNQEACQNLPACLAPTPSESQPGGGLPGAQPVTLAPGERLTVTVTIGRNGIAESEPLYLLYTGTDAVASDVLGRSPDGTLTVTGSREPFTGNTAQVTLTASANAQPSTTLKTVYVGVRKVNSQYAPSGLINIGVIVK